MSAIDGIAVRSRRRRLPRLRSLCPIPRRQPAARVDTTQCRSSHATGAPLPDARPSSARRHRRADSTPRVFAVPRELCARSSTLARRDIVRQRPRRGARYVRVHHIGESECARAEARAPREPKLLSTEMNLRSRHRSFTIRDSAVHRAAVRRRIARLGPRPCTFCCVGSVVTGRAIACMSRCRVGAVSSHAHRAGDATKHAWLPNSRSIGPAPSLAARATRGPLAV